MIGRNVTYAALICLCLAATVPGVAEEKSEPTAETLGAVNLSEPCCFTNPRYTGVCQVTPGADESCSSILGYLNNPNSVGKGYCGNTKVRGGWAQTDCEGAASVANGTPCGVEPFEE